MNKPVIITEDVLTAPVVVEAPTMPPSALAPGDKQMLAPDDKQTLAPVYSMIFAISLSHFLNDLMQSLIPSLYPILKTNYALDFGQIGMITLAFQFTSSLLQPLVGIYTDRNPRPYSLPIGMTVTLSPGCSAASWTRSKRALTSALDGAGISLSSASTTVLAST